MNLSVTHQSQRVQDAGTGVAIVRATTARLVDAFVELPYTMYANDRRWVPPLRWIDWERQATYRVTILPRPAGRCLAACDDGVKESQDTS